MYRTCCSAGATQRVTVITPYHSLSSLLWDGLRFASSSGKGKEDYFDGRLASLLAFLRGWMIEAILCIVSHAGLDWIGKGR